MLDRLGDGAVHGRQCGRRPALHAAPIGVLFRNRPIRLGLLAMGATARWRQLHLGDNMMRRKARNLLVPVFAAATLAAACGGDNSGSTASPGTTAAAATTAASSAATTAAGGATTAAGGAATTAGSVAPATGDPIILGFTNLEGGAISLPEVRIGAEQGIAY